MILISMMYDWQRQVACSNSAASFILSTIRLALDLTEEQTRKVRDLAEMSSPAVSFVYAERELNGMVNNYQGPYPGDEIQGHGADHDTALLRWLLHVTYEDVSTGMGIFTSRLGMPALVGEIVTGFLLGPPLADFVPFPEAMRPEHELFCGVAYHSPPFGRCGFGVYYGCIYPSAMAVGASFSPTSADCRCGALKAGKMIDTPVRQLIVAACVIIDILALILLSMFQVLVMDSPPIIQYFIPIISSLGFLVVLGGSAVTWMPKFIENKILLNSFMEDPQLMTWLLRVFFAAHWFQMPFPHFGDPFGDSKSDKYNPFLRDRLITGLSMTCRGEFSFIIAAFALGEGLFNAKIYAAIVFAVLLSCITSPFMLLNIIKYFNTKQAEYFASTNPHKLNKGSNEYSSLPAHQSEVCCDDGIARTVSQNHRTISALEIVERRTNRQGRGT
ncbi:hypothetical protein ACHAWO_003978 [Cyclotella atomus]|uniref:Cation/H+ exchanger transmembrane domain-containing protein n=1 Tax=Cyclotella atomus TaxID=382360 RepID=A0ABD3PW90_9STRA